MKRFFAFAAVAALLLTGCAGGQETPVTTAPTAQTETQPAVQESPAPLEVLQTVWEAMPEDSKFPSFGGEMTEEIQEGPGAYNMTGTDPLIYSLLVPEQQVDKVKEAASLIHMMNANTFTCGAFRVEGVSAEEFASAMKERILTNQWICGFPERLVIAAVGDTTVVSAFGMGDVLNPFVDQLTAAYSGSIRLLADEPIGG